MRLDGRLRLVSCSPAARHFIGLPAHPVLCRAVWMLHRLGPTAPPWFAALRRAGETGLEQCINVCYGAPQEPRSLSLRILPEAGPDGRLAAITVAGRDRRDCRSAEAETQRRRAQGEVQQLTMILDNLAAGVTVVSASGQVVFRNRRAREITGTEPDLASLLGNTEGAAVFSPGGERLPAGRLPAARLLRGERVEGEEHILQRPDGGKRRVIASGSLVKGDGGPFAIVSFQDITRLQELESRREEYVQILSHDLRAPLTVITAGAQMIMNQSSEDHSVRHARAVFAAGRRIAGMIDDLVLCAGVDYRGVRLDLAPSDLMALLRNLLVEFQEAIDTSRVRLSCSCRYPWVTADRQHLSRVFVNLIANALQYSGPGSPVAVSVKEAEGQVVVSVADEGPGVAPDELPRLFERYYRGRAVRDTTHGMGLGLYVVKGLVEAHGGRVWAESAEGRGSTFYVALPALTGAGGSPS